MNAKQVKLQVSSVCLFMLMQSCLVSADAIIMSASNNIRIEVVDYLDSLQDILFWLPIKQDIPVVCQKLISNSVYPISVTLYNDSAAPIKIIKNAVGGLSNVQDHEVAQLYKYDGIAQAANKFLAGIAASFVVFELLNTFASTAWMISLEDTLEQVLTNGYKKIQCSLSAALGVITGITHWQGAVNENDLINAAISSQVLSDELIIAPNSSDSFMMFASHAPSGYTLQVPVFNEKDEQIAMFSCQFGAPAAS